MAETLYGRLLSAESFLLPIVNEESLNVVLDAINDYQLHPLQALAKELLALSYQIQSDYYFDIDLFNTVFEINADNVADFMVGFRTPLVVLQSCFDRNRSFIDKYSIPQPTDPYIQTARRKVLLMVTRCTNDNLAVVGTKVFNLCEDHPFIDNEYYRVGTTAALITFREFTIKISFTE